jgi:TonB-linked SusC/RagA family outer membrane protein
MIIKNRFMIAFKLKKLRLLMFVFAILLVNLSYAQQKTITGTVTDQSTGEMLPGVTIVIDGTTTGTITDLDGKYSINASSDQTLTYSFVGYEKKSVLIDGQSVINIQLVVGTEDLGEVVVIGYGTVKKDDATGSIASVRSEDFNKGALTSPQELIVGKSAGVVVTSNGGAPGAGSTIRIRGGSSLKASNDPLIVIDGFPVDNTTISGLSNPLSTINPNDIESMTILKDASATAIYGSRASNGVVIITTKKGMSGKPFKITYDGNTSVSSAVKFMEVLTGDELRSLINDRIANANLTKVILDRIGTENTDWQKQIYRNALSTDHNLSVTGNIQNMPYRASMGYTNQNGILKKSNMNRTSLDLSAAPSFFDKHLTANLNLKGIDINNNFSNTDAIGSAISFDPTQPIMNGNTRYGGYTAWTELSSNDPINGVPNNIATHNPVARLEFRDNNSDVTRLIGNAQIDYKFHFLPALRANLNMGYDHTKSAGHDYTDPRASWSFRNPESSVKDYSHIVKSQLLDFYLNYNKDLKNISSKIDVTAGYSWQHFYREKSDANRPWEMKNGIYENSDTVIVKNENYLVSFFGRVNYTILDRYLFTVTVREDGSSRFGKDNRWGLFPSAAFAWKIKQESFLKDVKSISDLKLRLGYGITGQQDISDNFYPYMATYGISQQASYYRFGDTYYPMLRPNAYDVTIKWEETTTINGGVDFGFFENRILGSFDYYKRTTNNLINNIPIAVGTNFSNSLTTNVGSLENTGFEAMLTVRPVVTKDFLFEIGATFSYNKNEITKLTQVNDPNYVGYPTGAISGGVGNTVQTNNIGHPANSFFLYQQVYDANWMPIEGLYVNRSGAEGSVGAGAISRKYFAGKPSPDYLVGITSKLNYKSFDFSFNGRVSIGNYVYNNNASNMAIYINLYNQSGYASNIPKAINSSKFTSAQFWSDFYLEDASFFRMDNISLGYSFSKLFTDKLNGRVGLTVQNAFVITKYSGLDPEVDGGIDNNIYPRPRVIVLGVSLEF